MKEEMALTLNSLERAISKIVDRLDSIEKRLNESEESQVAGTQLSSYELRLKNINECIDMMNWKRIHDVMTYLNWQWIGEGEDGGAGVPSIDSLIGHTKDNLLRCYEMMDDNNASKQADEQEEDWMIYSGGIKVRTFPDNNCEVYFILSDASTWE